MSHCRKQRATPSRSTVTSSWARLWIKGVDPSPGAPRRVSTLKSELAQRGVDVPVFVDGGIRRYTVEPLAQAKRTV